MRTVTLPDKTFMTEVVALLAGGKQVTLKVKGNSMLPFIVGGLDSVVLQKQESYRRGDVVLAEVGQSRFVLHRIIRIDGNVVVLMGDGNLTGTEQCGLPAVHGRAIFIVRNSNSRPVNCGRGRIWHMLLPVRRYLLAIYRRI